MSDMMKPFDQAWTLLKQTSSEAARYYFQNKKMNMGHNLSPNFNDLPAEDVAAILSQMQNSDAGTLHDRLGSKLRGGQTNMFTFADNRMVESPHHPPNHPLPSANPSENQTIREQFPAFAEQQ